VVSLVPNGPLGEQRLAALEQELEVTLPASYRGWQATTGGGAVTDDVEVPGMDDPDLLVDLYGDAASGAPAYADLVTTRRAQLAGEGFIGLLPSRYLAVGSGNDGHLVLVIEEPDAGSVWWFDFTAVGELEEDARGEVPGATDTLRRLADDLPDLLGDL
jgi:hypothetical protein